MPRFIKNMPWVAHVLDFFTCYLFAMFFVTGNDNKWREIKEILGDSIEIKRSVVDCKLIHFIFKTNCSFFV